MILMRKKFVVALALTFLVSASVQAKESPEIVELTPKKISAENSVPEVFYNEKNKDLYQLRGGDELVIRVYGYPEISSPDNGTTPYVIRLDGKFYMPLIGEIDALNRTVPDICQEIETRYKKYLRNPKVDINVMKISKIHVCVLGQVEKQGFYEFERAPRLLEAISSAWGFVGKSSKKNVFVIRAGEQEPCLKIDLRKFLKGESTGHNIVLNEGDCVYITSNHKISFAKDIHPIISSMYFLNRIE